jgi:AraC-like DNA-binding protein
VRIWNVASMAAAVRMTERGLRAAADRAGLPAPVQLRGLARALAQALVVQRKGEVTLTRVALELGHSHSEGLTHLLRSHFDVTPSYVRERLGWRWLAGRWLDRRSRSDPNRNHRADSVQAQAAG